MIRHVCNNKYYINSNKIEKQISESGYSVDINGKFFFYPTEIICSNITDDLFLKEEYEKIKALCSDYKSICDKYDHFIECLIEITLTKKQITIMTDNKYLYDEYYLYSLNIHIVSKITNRVYDRGFGGRNNFESINKLHDELICLLKLASLSNQTKKIQAGFYDVILDQEATGLFVHEFIGHLFEADNDLISTNDIESRKKITNDFVSIIDNPTLKNGFGTYLFDDEGTIAQETYIIKDGRMNSFLHSKQTGAIHGKSTTSNARAIDFSHKPLVRMSNTYMLPNKTFTAEDLIKSVEYGIYVKGTRDSISGSNAILGFREMYLIKDGVIGNLISNMKIVGNTFSILNKIEMIANDLKIYGGGRGGCFKMKQGPLDVSAGGPHIKLKSVMLIPDINSPIKI